MDEVKELVEVLRGEKPIIVDVPPATYIYLGASMFLGMIMALMLVAVITKKI